MAPRRQSPVKRDGRAVVAVLPLNRAARYATHLIAMRDGQIVAEGARRTSSPPT